MSQTPNQTIQKITVPIDSVFFVSEDMVYPGRFVNKRIGLAIGAEIEQQQAVGELVDLNHDFELIVQSTAEVILAFGAVSQWEALQAWLKFKNAYNNIVGSLKRLQDTIAKQNRHGMHFVKMDSPAVLDLNTMIDDLTRLMGDFTQARAAYQLREKGQRLVDFVKSRSINQQGEKLFMNMRRAIDLGGQPSKPHLEALYRLALPLHNRLGRKWAEIALALWDTIRLKTHDEQSLDERMVFEVWADMTPRKRKEQLRGIFPSAADMREGSI